MCQAETLGILDEIQSLVSDQLQVVSYKWLSRNYLVSSNSAKRLLQEFVERHGDGLEVVYTLSGWLKNDPSVYHVQLVSRQKLAEAREEFARTCSVHVYSVQASIPKDPAVLWNAEFVQAEGLFNQQDGTPNCLKDNRFGGIANPFVKRDGGTSTNVALPPNASNSKLEMASLPSGKAQEISSSKVQSELSVPVVKDLKDEARGARVSAQANKLSEDKERVTSLEGNKNVGKNGNGSRVGGSLASMWGRASTKPKSGDASVENRTTSSSIVSAEAQICARELAELSSDDEGCDADFKRTSNGKSSRKRRVVFDDSDEEGEHLDGVSLASPDVPKAHSCLASNETGKRITHEKSKLDLDEPDKVKAQVEKKELNGGESKGAFREDMSSVRGMEAGASSSERSGCPVGVSDDKVICPAPRSPKRKKVLRTRIDERGREVTEVVWEGEEEATKKKSATVDKPAGNGAADVVNRPPATKKSPAVIPTGPGNPFGKAGSKKVGNKDPKQGNIMSFFKRV